MLSFQVPFGEFWESFEHHLKYSMVILKREPVVERTIEFAAKFATSLVKDPEDKEKEVKEALEEEEEEEDDDMHPFLLKLFTFLLNVSSQVHLHQTLSQITGWHVLLVPYVMIYA